MIVPRRQSARQRGMVERYSPGREVNREQRERSSPSRRHSGQRSHRMREEQRRRGRKRALEDDFSDPEDAGRMRRGGEGRSGAGQDPYHALVADLMAGSQGGNQAGGLGLPGVAVAKKPANADIAPMVVDESVGFDMVGGLDTHVAKLKEMVFLPLLYPEVFDLYKVTPPRGVLFYGPPGTGKTLCARALAAGASRGGKKVSFFMRKGADVLSKWVGEAERQLRALFEEAQRLQPSIIFFDEIDGLAPVRSSKQDQIHNSIVSTLLALMDGLDSRGSVVVLGATNRLDSLDPALRRPGRFDRELLFPLPSLPARRTILDIHTRKWQAPPAPEVLDELAHATVGYCGADLKSLCAESAIGALRRTYPQIYESERKLLIDADSVRVETADFRVAMKGITPASHRSALVYSAPLSRRTEPLLQMPLRAALGVVREAFPPADDALRIAASQARLASGSGTTGGAAPMEVEAESLAELDGLDGLDGEENETLASAGGPAYALSLLAVPHSVRPRLLLVGTPGAGQNAVAPALLHALESLPVHGIGLPSLVSDAGSRSPEEALVLIIGEARRAAPSVLYLPQLHTWWEAAHDQLRCTLLALLADLPPELPVLLVATADADMDADADMAGGAAVGLDPRALALFAPEDILEVSAPNAAARAEFFEPVLQAALAGPQVRPRVERAPPPPLPEVPEAPEEERVRSPEEITAEKKREEDALRRLRMQLRFVVEQVTLERKWKLFVTMLGDDELPGLRRCATSLGIDALDVCLLLSGIDSGRFKTLASFEQGVADMVRGVCTYFEREIEVRESPEDSVAAGAGDYSVVESRRIISKARAMEDFFSEKLACVDATLAAECEAIVARRAKEALAGPSGHVAAPTRPTRQQRGEVSDALLRADPEAAARLIRAEKRAAMLANAGIDDSDNEGGQEGNTEEGRGAATEAAAEASPAIPEGGAEGVADGAGEENSGELVAAANGAPAPGASAPGCGEGGSQQATEAPPVSHAPSEAQAQAMRAAIASVASKTEGARFEYLETLHARLCQALRRAMAGGADGAAERTAASLSRFAQAL